MKSPPFTSPVQEKLISNNLDNYLYHGKCDVLMNYIILQKKLSEVSMVIVTIKERRLNTLSNQKDLHLQLVQLYALPKDYQNSQ